MRNFLQRIAEAIKREPAAFAQIDRTGHLDELPRGQQDHLAEKGQTPQRRV